MYITDTRPVKVNGFVIPYDFGDMTKTLPHEPRRYSRRDHLQDGQ